MSRVFADKEPPFAHKAPPTNSYIACADAMEISMPRQLVFATADALLNEMITRSQATGLAAKSAASPVTTL